MTKTMIKQVLEQLCERGWTDAAVAGAVDVSSVTIYRWRTGKSAPVVVPGAILGMITPLLDLAVPPRVHRGGRPRKVRTTEVM